MSPVVKTAPLVVALCLMAARLMAADGILIVQKHTAGGTTQTHQIQIENTRMRAETRDVSGRTQVMVFDAAAQLIRIIDPEKRRTRR